MSNDDYWINNCNREYRTSFGYINIPIIKDNSKEEYIELKENKKKIKKEKKHLKK